MEFKHPKRKRWCNLELEQAFPIFIQSEIGVPIDNWVSFVYTGIFNGFGVVVKDPAEINALHGMGNFGKGSSSRSRPEIMRNNSKLPKIISKQQFIHRQQWVETSKIDDNTDFQPTEADRLLVEIAELHTYIDNIPTCYAPLDNDNETSVSEKSEVMNILSSDDENCLNVTTNEKNKQNDSLVDDKMQASNVEVVQCSEQSQNSIDDVVFPINSVVVLSDNDSEKDDFLQCVKPKICIDKSGNKELLVLTLEEAYFLAYGLGCLQILDQHEKVLNLKESWRLFSRTEKKFKYKYIVYHYYRSKGWIVKPGIKFGGDFLLYKDGQPYYHASYIVLVETPNTLGDQSFDWKTILGLLRMAGTAAKEVVIAQVCTVLEEVEKLCEDPSYISHCKVSEVLLRRWICNHERGDDEDY